MIVSNKRAWLAERLCRLGFVRLLERVGRRPGLVILTYHRVGDLARDPFYRPLIVDPVVFERQMRDLRNAFRLTSLAELERQVDGTGRLTLVEPTALVTFDDGYRDNWTVAAPILASLAVPAVLLVTTGFLNPGGMLPWWDRLAFAVQNSRRSELTLDGPAGQTFPLKGDRAEVVRLLVARHIEAGWGAGEEELARLEACTGIDGAERDAMARDLFLSREELSKVGAPGSPFTLGAHTRTHRLLGRLATGEQADELGQPKVELEACVKGLEIDAVAYPYGAADSATRETRRLAQDAGYRWGFGVGPHQIRPGSIDCWNLPRFLVGPADSASLLRARLALSCHLRRSPL